MMMDGIRLEVEMLKKREVYLLIKKKSVSREAIILIEDCEKFLKESECYGKEIDDFRSEVEEIIRRRWRIIELTLIKARRKEKHKIIKELDGE